MNKKLLYILFVFLVHTNFAQDNNYWMQMPGSKAALMGGVVVAGVRDNSAVYYNPGAIGFLDTTTLSLSASTYQYEYGSIQNAGGIGVNMTSSKFQAFPLVSISGVFFPKKVSRHSFGFMLFTKNQTASNYSYRFDGNKSSDVFAGDGYSSPNKSVEYIGDYNLQTQLNELWLGFTYAYQLNRHIAVGLSPFVAYRTETFNQSINTRAFADSLSNFMNIYNQDSNYNNNPIYSIGYSDVQSMTFTNFRALAKIGIAFDYGRLKMGITYTTRSMNLGGSAMIARDILVNSGNANTPSGGGATTLSTYSLVFNDRQSNLRTTYISPYSVSGGIDYQLQRTTFAVSAEYFGPVAAYELATPQATSFQRPVWANTSKNWGGIGGQPVNSNDYLRILEGSKSVTNIGVAIEQQVKRNLTLVTSFRTDYTSYLNVSNDFWQQTMGDTSRPKGQKINISNINLYHLTLGVILKNKRSDVHIGLAYCFGKNTFFQPFNNLADPSDANNVLGIIPSYAFSSTYVPSYIENAIYKYQSFSLLLGYTYHLSTVK
jgi:hypothetical protein